MTPAVFNCVDDCLWNILIYGMERVCDDIANDYTHCCQARALLMQRLQVCADITGVDVARAYTGCLQDSVVTIEDFQAMCRHNDYMHDPESKCNCSAQVCSSKNNFCIISSPRITI